MTKKKAKKKRSGKRVADLTMGQRLKVWRRGMDLTMTELREVIPVSQGSWSDIETGKSLPSAETIILIYKFLKKQKPRTAKRIFFKLILDD